MVNAEGEFVVAEPDKASWDQFQAKAKVSAAAQEAAKTGSKELQDRGLECSIDKRLFVEPTKTPCCGRTYCNDCITNALIDGDLTCPGCQSEGILIDDLKPDEELAAKVKSYVEEQEALKEAKEGSKSPDAPSEKKIKSPSKDIKSPSPSASIPRASTATPTSVNGTSKKRPAGEEADGQRPPKGPAGMQKQQPQSQQSLGTNMGFPAMPFNQQQPFPDLFGPGSNQMGFQNGNGFMGMPMSTGPMMGMDPSMMNPMMMNGYGGGMNGFNNMGGMNFPQQQDGMYGGGYSGMMPSGGYGQQPQMPMMMPNMNGMQPNMGANGTFSNQQQNAFSQSVPADEDNAYFRKPVNPHRHQARQRRMRPSDYHEL